MSDLIRDPGDDETPSERQAGVAVIEAALATLPFAPGVYRMLDAKGDALYVGKARSLKKRVHAYTQTVRLPERLRRMVFETRHLEVITTASEAEALLLEANLIKKLRPRFNIVLRDDKSYPCCAPAATRCSRRATGPACSTRSAAAPRPASSASGGTTMPSWSARPGSSCPARRRPSRRSSPPRWSRRPRRWNSSAPPRSATASAA
jgi:hypothetical protein